MSDNKSATPAKPKTPAERIAAMKEQIRDLEYKEQTNVVMTAVKEGHVTDPKKAKDLSRKITALQRSRETVISCGWANEKQVSDKIEEFTKGLKALVKLPPAAAKPAA